MFKTNLVIALRNLLKYKFYSFLNITGLAIGIAVCLLILLFVQDELNYDKYNDKADRIYRIIADFSLGGNELHTPDLGAPTGPAFLADFPEVENYVRIQTTGGWFVQYGDKSFKETEVLRADSTFFDIFTIPLISGNPITALNKPHTLVLSQRAAVKYFGKEDPLGKTLKLDNRTDYEVTGVYKDIPANSHFQAEFILALNIKPGTSSDYWLGNMNNITYIVLQENYDYKKLEAKFPAMIEKYIGPEIIKFTGKTLEEFFKAGNRTGFYLQPLADIHLYSDLQDDIGVNGDIKYVLIFSAIAVFILIIACINFMNLSTARSSGRAKEVGVKKVLGSGKGELVKQFLTESMVMSLLAMIFALIIIPLVLPFFNNLSGKELHISSLLSLEFLAGIITLTVLIGILAGSYPALFISSFNPASILKGELRSGTGNGTLRSSLVVFQFAASIIMITATIVVAGQLNYIQNKKLGFNKEQVLVVHDTFILGDRAQSFKNEVAALPGILSGTVTNALPVESPGYNNGTFRDGRPDDEKLAALGSWSVDEDYIPTLGMEIIKGRNFSKEFGSDSLSVVINEAVAQHFEWDDPVGKVLSQFSSNDGSQITNYHVIGVVKNFHYESLKNSIGPVMFFMRHGNSRTAFRFKSDNTSGIIESIKSKWEEFVPGQAFEYTFMDEDFNKTYSAEQKVGEIFSVFAFLAIFIGCLGLFGLAAYTAEQKTKEIGIRKVLGASVPGIVFLLSSEFVKLIIIAFVVAAPIAYYYMNMWLQDFHYRIDLTSWMFASAGLIALGIAMLTVSYHAIKIAITNPSKSLRYE